MDRIELLLLGSVEATSYDGVLPLGGRRQKELLALLALSPATVVASDVLIDALWDGSPPAGADTTLRSYVSRLRQALGRGAVAARSGGYALAVDPDVVDVRRFETYFQQGREAMARGAAGLGSERLHAALALWRGRALADVGRVRPLVTESMRLEELRLACLEERIEADLALGRHADLVTELRPLVQEHPLRERFWRQLVVVLYRCGRQAEALAACQEARRLLRDELGLDPGEELRGLETAILRQDVAAVPPARTRHNLPAPSTDLIGRERELADLEHVLRARRLVSVTGMGGSGKTRLVLEVARRQVDAWRDGVWLVELAAVTDAALVVDMVAATVGVTDDGVTPPRDALIAHLEPLELLVVLDNCEHVVDACAELTDAVLRCCPNVRVLATSRVPLGVYGEHDHRLDPLAAPPAEASDEDVQRSPAVRLFTERVVAVAHLVDDERARRTIGRICRELDGLPLALELAAARAKALSLDEIAARLDDRFRFLRAWQRVAPPRHRTLRTTMDWSHELLTADEQQLLRRLSVFADGTTLEAVVDICVDGDADRAVDLLERLVDASLVRREDGEQLRYRLLETVRQYAAWKLADHADADAVRRRHAEHYLAVAESANLSIESLGRGPQHPEIVLREQHNLRAAIDWATSADVEVGIRLMLALENFWVTAALAEGARRFERLLARADGVDTLLLARANRDYAACLDVQQEFARARPAYEKSRRLFGDAGDELGVAYLDYRLGIVTLWQEGDVDAARQTWRRCLETFRRHGDAVAELQALGDLGTVELAHDRDSGRAMVEQSVAMAREAGWQWWAERKLGLLAAAAAAVGDADEAEERGREFLALAVRTANSQDILFALAILARAAAARGDDRRAVRLWAAVDAVDDGPGRFGKFDRAEYAASMPDLPRPGPIPLDEAVALALAD